MATIVRGPKDQAVKKIKAALDQFEEQSPGAVATLYRQNSASVRVRVVSPQFARQSKGTRHDRVWKFLEDRLDDDTLPEISVLLLLTPEEQAASFMNFEFDSPIKSGF